VTLLACDPCEGREASPPRPTGEETDLTNDYTTACQILIAHASQPSDQQLAHMALTGHVGLRQQRYNRSAERIMAYPTGDLTQEQRDLVASFVRPADGDCPDS